MIGLRRASAFALVLLHGAALADPDDPTSDAQCGKPTPGHPLAQPCSLPSVRPIVSIDDRRTQGPTARNWFDATVESTYLHGGAPVFTGAGYASQDVYGLAGQLAFGDPPPLSREVGDILRPTTNYAGRVRAAMFFPRDGSATVGPLTFAGQRYVPVEQVSLTPLADAHLGIEFAVSTPWLSGRDTMPAATVQQVDAVDTELARDGWSVRPASGYFRADFLVCRSFHFEAGAGPELFVPTTGADEYDLRDYAAVGWSFGCSQNATDFLPKLELEYRQRHRLYEDDAGYAFFQSLGVALQEDLGFSVVQLFATVDPAAAEHHQIGLRVQLGVGK